MGRAYRSRCRRLDVPYPRPHPRSHRLSRDRPVARLEPVGLYSVTEVAARFVELDSIFHQPNWEPLPVPQLRAAVAAIVAADAWVIDGNYSAVRDLVWARADTVVFFDLPRRMVMRQVGWRTARRATTGAELWNGNRESWRNRRLSTDRPVARLKPVGFYSVAGTRQFPVPSNAGAQRQLGQFGATTTVRPLPGRPAARGCTAVICGNCLASADAASRWAWLLAS